MFRQQLREHHSINNQVSLNDDTIGIVEDQQYGDCSGRYDTQEDRQVGGREGVYDIRLLSSANVT